MTAKVVKGKLDRVVNGKGIFITEDGTEKEMQSSILPTKAQVGDAFNIALHEDGEIKSVAIQGDKKEYVRF